MSQHLEYMLFLLVGNVRNVINQGSNKNNTQFSN